MENAIFSIINEIFILFIQMAPYLLFGFIVSGLLYVLIPRSFIIKHLKPNKTSSIFKAAVLGVPLPLCSCGVIPVAAHLRKQGANKSATVSFLASTPSTGADSIFATYSLMGPIYTVFRPIDALFSGFLAGILVKLFNPSEDISVDNDLKQLRYQVAPKASLLHASTLVSASTICNKQESKPQRKESECCERDVQEQVPTSSCCASEPKAELIASSCCASENPSEEKASSCCTSNDSDDKTSTAALPFVDKMKKAIHYGLFELIDDTKKWILIGIIVGGVLSWGIPSELGEYWIDYPVLSYLSMLVIGLPMYVCATASIPIATALLMNGLSPGAALVFLAVGPATNTATIAFLSSSMGKKNMFIYVFSISFSAILLGIILDIFYGETLTHYFQTAGHASHIGLMDYVFSAILAGLILFQYTKKKPSIR